jgi:D-glycero-D-manno-heptose 1,7-bisphosphate phosphatase
VPTIFLDRDGVIDHNRPDYVKSWNEFRFLPGARRAIARLTHAGYQIIVVTNQACIGKGLVSPTVVDEVHHRMIHEVEQAGGRIKAVLYCPHRPEAACDCRKPAPGLLLRARDHYGVDLSRAVFVGDGIGDLQAAAAAGMPAILVLTGLGLSNALRLLDQASHRCQLALNLAHAARLIVRSGTVAGRESTWLWSALRGMRAIKHYQTRKRETTRCVF